ncbi:MAG: D-alanyl-D-alanine carboxypeptidase [Xenococcaceae cyanobacterium]
MGKTIRSTAALSITLLALVAGCSDADSPQGISPFPQSDGAREQVNPVEPVEKPDIPQTVTTEYPDPATQKKIEQYLNGIAAKGFPQENQGVWMQGGNTLLANHRGTVPLPAASIAKVATTLAALQTFGPDHQFVTLFGATGPIQNGVLQGDLVIQGGEDPFFVWEEAVATGNLLNQIGIKGVTGNLVITGKFYMNFELDSLKSGNLLKQGLNAQIWPPEAETQYQTLPPGTPRPQVAIEGSVKVMSSSPSNVRHLLRHYSFPLAELIKKMNRYSNNVMAGTLTDSVGGAKVVAQKAAEAAGVPQAEIQLGLGNRISPRAAVAMFLAIERYLQPYNMTVADVFAIVGKDKGILEERQLPRLSVLKSGIFNNISALAGGLPTKGQGTVWFAIMNLGAKSDEVRTEQEVLLKSLLNDWGEVQFSPAELTPLAGRKSKTSRTEVVKK